jgi:HAD superfamily hydrolase (TIGR01509 family)
MKIRGVLWDLHGTLIDQGSVTEWLDAAVAASGTSPGHRAELEVFLDRIWENARVLDPDSSRDLSPEAHYRIFHELLEQGPGATRALGDALYESMLPLWRAYEDAVPTMRRLNELGIRQAVISNVGVDVRHVLQREGIEPLVDAVILSCEVGCVKPDPRIFAAALAALHLDPTEALMVGDSGKDDTGGIPLGIRTVILPRTSGPIHGLAGVRALVEESQRG